ncbi:hypothetical protein EJ08DRAFT_164555 [Tothia fuscella]|uniref:Uncharacterized protein n=1 Tax=Tothia fuscella TaxID=1048955 RepID=A0A9P4NUB3_9PEZI|nr:hypothetical protein EJ08DRAFT_164555 [Tothia fuscella]
MGCTMSSPLKSSSDSSSRETESNPNRIIPLRRISHPKRQDLYPAKDIAKPPDQSILNHAPGMQDLLANLRIPSKSLDVLTESFFILQTLESSSVRKTTNFLAIKRPYQRNGTVDTALYIVKVLDYRKVLHPKETALLLQNEPKLKKALPILRGMCAEYLESETALEKLLQSISTDNSSTPTWFAQPHISNCLTLQDFVIALKRTGRPLPWFFIFHIFHQLCEILSWLHTTSLTDESFTATLNALTTQNIILDFTSSSPLLRTERYISQSDLLTCLPTLKLANLAAASTTNSNFHEGGEIYNFTELLVDIAELAPDGDEHATDWILRLATDSGMRWHQPEFAVELWREQAMYAANKVFLGVNAEEMVWLLGIAQDATQQMPCGEEILRVYQRENVLLKVR